MKDINIVIVNWKMKDDIDACLSTLVLDIQDSDLDVVVHIMDNSDNIDGIKEMLAEKYPQVTYINSGGNIGFGKANNIALQRVEAKYYFVLNPDTKFEAGTKTLRSLYEYMEKNIQVGMIGPKLLNNDGTLQLSCFRFPRFLDKPVKHFKIHRRIPYFAKRVDYFMMKDFDHNSERPVDWIMGSAMFVRHKATQDVGYFDDRYFMYLEDCDWCRRMWEHYWQVRYIPSVILYHKHRRDSAKVPGIRAIIKNPITRIHIKSWLQYSWKWKFRSKKYYQE